MSRVIFVTTRLYYMIDSCEVVHVDHDRIMDFIRNLDTSLILNNQENVSDKAAFVFNPYDDCDNDTNVEEQNDTSIIKYLFLNKGSSTDLTEEAINFWNDWDGNFFLKHISIQNNGVVQYDLYVAPCFPTRYNNNDLSIRHNYICAIFGDLFSDNDDAILLAHDKDLYLSNEERPITEDDCNLGNNQLPSNLAMNNIVGFQHAYDSSKFYKDFIIKLTRTITSEDCDLLLSLFTTGLNNRKILSEIDKLPFDSNGHLRNNCDSNTWINKLNEIKW